MPTRSVQKKAKLAYVEPRWQGRALSLMHIASDNEHSAEAMMALALNDRSPELIEGVASSLLLGSASARLKKAALTSIGHSARLHRRLAFEETRTLLEKFARSRTYGGVAQDALDDLAVFVPKTSRKLARPTAARRRTRGLVIKYTDSSALRRAGMQEQEKCS